MVVTGRGDAGRSGRGGGRGRGVSGSGGEGTNKKTDDAYKAKRGVCSYYYGRDKHCTYGDSCAYLHDKSLCYYMMTHGSCGKKEECKYSDKHAKAKEVYEYFGGKKGESVERS